LIKPSYIYHIAPYFPPHLGGLQEAANNLAQAQASTGEIITVITSNLPRLPHLKQQTNLKIIRLFTLEFAHTPIMPGLFLALCSSVRRKGIIHVHFAQPYLPEVVVLYHFMTRRPFIFHFHGDVMPSGKFGKLLVPYKKYILPISLKRASIIVFPSSDFKQRIVQNYPFIKLSKTAVIPNGITLPILTALPSTTPKYFLYVGRLAKVKNVSFIIKAFHIANNTNPGMSLLIVGAGEEQDKLQELVKELEEADSIHFLGYQPKSNIYELYMQAHALLVASERESFGMSIVEAMACGVPVIACYAPGVREIVRDEFKRVYSQPMHRI
jgi:glycosyltransferase involved in cell wall biosynthesis